MALWALSARLLTHAHMPPPSLAAVAAADLEDREAGDEAWTVGSRPSRDGYQPSSRVGAFAAAAGRGASAFVEAFRSAMGTHRTSYSRRTSGSGGA